MRTYGIVFCPTCQLPASFSSEDVTWPLTHEQMLRLNHYDRFDAICDWFLSGDVSPDQLNAILTEH